MLFWTSLITSPSLLLVIFMYVYQSVFSTHWTVTHVDKFSCHAYHCEYVYFVKWALSWQGSLRYLRRIVATLIALTPATHCSALQRTATHRNALQHTATHCSTLHHMHTHVHTHIYKHIYTHIHSHVRTHTNAKSDCVFSKTPFFLPLEKGNA